MHDILYLLEGAHPPNGIQTIAGFDISPDTILYTSEGEASVALISFVLKEEKFKTHPEFESSKLDSPFAPNDLRIPTGQSDLFTFKLLLKLNLGESATFQRFLDGINENDPSNWASFEEIEDKFVDFAQILFPDYQSSVAQFSPPSDDADSFCEGFCPIGWFYQLDEPSILRVEIVISYPPTLDITKLKVIDPDNVDQTAFPLVPISGILCSNKQLAVAVPVFFFSSECRYVKYALWHERDNWSHQAIPYQEGNSMEIIGHHHDKTGMNDFQIMIPKGTKDYLASKAFLKTPPQFYQALEKVIPPVPGVNFQKGSASALLYDKKV